VIGVEVGEHEQRHPAYPQAVQAAVDHVRVRPGVDDHGRAGSDRQRERVALADVARDHDPAGRRPADRTDDVSSAEHERGTANHRAGCKPMPDQPRSDRDGEHDHEQHEYAPDQTVPPWHDRPRLVRAGPGHPDDPVGRPARDRADNRGNGFRRLRNQGRAEAQNRGRRDRGRGEQVCDQRHDADLAGQHHDDRQRRELRSRGQRNGVGEHGATQRGTA